jgi:hypothetical protein
MSGGLQLNAEFFARHGCGAGQGRERQARIVSRPVDADLVGAIGK